MAAEVLDNLVVKIRSYISSSTVPLYDLENPTSPHHLLWMLNQMPNVKPETVNVWVGYLSGLMICQGMVDIDKEIDLLKSIMND